MALDVVRLQAEAPASTAWQGLPLRKLLASLELVTIDAIDDEARDVDTWADLRDLKGCGGR
jgi:hypothetical protein